MINRSSSGNRLGRQALLFSSVSGALRILYLHRQRLIQPGMLAVVEQYNAGIEWVPTSTDRLSGGRHVFYSGF